MGCDQNAYSSHLLLTYTDVLLSQLSYSITTKGIYRDEWFRQAQCEMARSGWVRRWPLRLVASKAHFAAVTWL